MSHYQNFQCFIDRSNMDKLQDHTVKQNMLTSINQMEPHVVVEKLKPPKPRSRRIGSKYKVCPICTRRFPNCPTLRDHMQYHEYLTYQCSHCPSMFATFRGMARHRCRCSNNLSVPTPPSPYPPLQAPSPPLTEDKAVQVHFKLKFKRRDIPNSDCQDDPECRESFRKLRSADQHPQFMPNGIYTIVNDEPMPPMDPIPQLQSGDAPYLTTPTNTKRKSTKEKILKRDLPGLKYIDLMANVEKLKLLYFMQNENGRFKCPMCGKESTKSVGALNHIRMHPDLAPVLEYYTACSEGAYLSNWDPNPQMPFQSHDTTGDTLPQNPVAKMRRKRKARRASRGYKWRRILGEVSTSNPHECIVCQQIFHKPFGIAAHYMRCHQLDMEGLVSSQVYADNSTFDNDRCERQDHQIENCHVPQLKSDKLEELEGNLNTVLGCMVKDVEVLQELGWPVRDVEHLLDDILSQCGQQQLTATAERPSDSASKLERLRYNVALLLRVCIKDTAMVTYGWDKKPVDAVLKEMLMASEIEQLVK